MTNPKNTSNKNAKSFSILGLLLFGFLHAQEGLFILISLLGVHEYSSNTQFIPGVSLAYWGMICLSMISLFIPFIYEIWIQARAPKIFSRPINFLFAGIFGLLLSINLLGKLEIIESTQFIPDFSFGHWGLMGFAIFALVAPLIHEIKRKASPIMLLASSFFGGLLSIIILGRMEIAENFQFIQGMNINDYIFMLFFLVFVFCIIFFIQKVFHKEYIYHYLRFLLLLIVGF